MQQLVQISTSFIFTHRQVNAMNSIHKQLNIYSNFALLTNPRCCECWQQASSANHVQREVCSSPLIGRPLSFFCLFVFALLASDSEAPSLVVRACVCVAI